MIWSSTLAMTILDLIIIGLVLAMLGVTWSLGMFKKGRVPRGGRVLVMLGATLTGLFYLADLIIMHAFRPLLEPTVATSLMDTLHLDVRWIVSLISLVMISVGVVMDAYQRFQTERKFRESEQQVAAARDRIIESEIRFRSLVEQTPDAVYCFEFQPPIPITTPVEDQIARSYDAVLIECNQVFANSIGAESPGHILGMRFGDMDSALDTESHTRLFHEFIKGGYRLVDYELKYSAQNGNPRALHLSITGVIRDGELVRLWGAEKDILEQNRTEVALEGRLHFQQFVAEISSHLLTAPDDKTERAIEQCLERVGRYIGADRANIIWLDQDKQSVDVLYFWNEHGGPPFVQLSLTNFPFLGPKLGRGEVVRASTLASFPVAAASDVRALTQLGVISLAIVPLIVAGKTLGACTFSTISEERNWTDQDVTDLRAFADLFANTVLRFNSRNELKGIAAELREAKTRLEAENVYLREEISSTHGFHELVGESNGLLDCLRKVARVATTTSAVLLQGETGTGKELIARAIHERSDRKNRPLVKVNCAALPANLIESELFGHEKGAFTGAISKKRGRFDLADSGTLFLDEIADLPLELQGKLLRVLQNGEFERLGGDETLKVDVRIIAATNRDLLDAVDHGQFRSDLYYRISTFPITLPPLRERGGDIALLAEHFVRKHAAKLGRHVTEISAAMMDSLQHHEWPGNIRELEGIIQRALISTAGPVLQLAEPLTPIASTRSSGSLAVQLDLRSNEREHIKRVLEQSKWVVTGEAGAATKLGVPPSTLRSKMKKLGIVRPADSTSASPSRQNH